MTEPAQEQIDATYLIEQLKAQRNAALDREAMLAALLAQHREETAQGDADPTAAPKS